MKKVIVFLAEGFEEIEAISVIDILRRAEITVQSVSITGNQAVLGVHGIRVEADILFEDANFSDADMLVLPGGGPGSNNLNKHENLKSVIAEQNKKGKWLAAICAAPLVLGEMGLLQGKKATCFPGKEPSLIGAILQNEAVVVDGNIITGKGPGFTTIFALQIVEELQGKTKANEVKASLLLSTW